MAARIVPLRTLVRSIGNSHEEFNEILRRIYNNVMLSDEETIVISQVVGTFYKQRRKATRRVLNGVEYILPARDVLQLRPPPMPAQPAVGETEFRTIFSTEIFQRDSIEGRENQADLRVDAFSVPVEIVSVAISTEATFSPLLTIGGRSFTNDDFEGEPFIAFNGVLVNTGLLEPAEVEFRQEGSTFFVEIEGDLGIGDPFFGSHPGPIQYDVVLRFLDPVEGDDDA